VPGNKGGESETIIGKWLKRTQKRQQVIIATKVGAEMSPGKKGLSKNYILAAVEDSLQRLQTDYIDLYQSHVDDPDTPLDETLEAYARLIEQGKIRAIGASNYTAKRLAERCRSVRKRACRGTGVCNHSITSTIGRVRGGLGASLPPRKHRRDPLLFTGQRISRGQVPFRSGFGQQRQRELREEISERARLQNPFGLDQVARTHSATQSK